MILDSGCSYHMTPNEDWFCTYENIDSGNIVIRNDATCRIVGIGSVKIKMHDEVVRTVTEVRHIPDLRKNLISLGILESKGYMYNDEGRIIQVAKDGVVVINGNKHKTLYVMQGSTITGSIALASQAVRSESELWHMQLEHLSQMGMNILSQKGFIRDLKGSKLEFCEHCVFGK